MNDSLNHINFTGTFGQEDSWRIETPSSWKHPAVPYEILIDPLSMPSHPALDEEINQSDVLDSEKSENVNKQVRFLDRPCELFYKHLFFPVKAQVVFPR